MKPSIYGFAREVAKVRRIRESLPSARRKCTCLKRRPVSAKNEQTRRVTVVERKQVRSRQTSDRKDAKDEDWSEDVHESKGSQDKLPATWSDCLSGTV